MAFRDSIKAKDDISCELYGGVFIWSERVTGGLAFEGGDRTVSKAQGEGVIKVKSATTRLFVEWDW
jgi:hypothetical protein